eukprot:6207747-Pleurochrysis_carterae.AAC.1
MEPMRRCQIEHHSKQSRLCLLCKQSQLCAGPSAEWNGGQSLPRRLGAAAELVARVGWAAVAVQPLAFGVGRARSITCKFGSCDKWMREA